VSSISPGTLLHDKQISRSGSLPLALTMNIGYVLMWNMPKVEPLKTSSGDDAFRFGFPIGTQSAEIRKFYLFNHLSFTILYHVPAYVTSDYLSAGNKAVYRVVGYEVSAKSTWVSSTCYCAGTGACKRTNWTQIFSRFCEKSGAIGCTLGCSAQIKLRAEHYYAVFHRKLC